MTTVATTARSPVHLGSRRVRSAVVGVLTASISLAVLGAVAPAPAHAAPRPAFTITDRTTAREVKSHEVGYLMASCKPGEERISGGFYNTAPAYSSTLSQYAVPDRYPVVANQPVGSLSWQVGLLNRSDGNTTLLVHVLCASTPLGAVVVSDRVQVENPTTGSPWHLVSCPAGTVVTGGGWSTGAIKRLNQVTAIGASMPSHGNADSWQVRFGIPAESTATTSDLVDVYAVCVAGKVVRSTSPDFRFRLLGGAVDEAVQSQQLASCPRSTTSTQSLLTSAGFDFSVADGTRSLTSLAPYTADVPSTWSVTVNSLAGRGFEGPVNSSEDGSLFSVCVAPPLLAVIGAPPSRPRLP